jgi:hypothetical protein
VVALAVKPSAVSAASVCWAQALVPASANSRLPSKGLCVGAWMVTVHDGCAAGSWKLPLNSSTPRAGEVTLHWISWRKLRAVDA